jgi:hypothetical protein
VKILTADIKNIKPNQPSSYHSSLHKPQSRPGHLERGNEELFPPAPASPSSGHLRSPTAVACMDAPSPSPSPSLARPPNQSGGGEEDLYDVLPPARWCPRFVAPRRRRARDVMGWDAGTCNASAGCAGLRCTCCQRRGPIRPYCTGSMSAICFLCWQARR